MRRMVCTIAVICATASSTFTVGWKYTRMTETPWYDSDSECSMSLTVVVRARSQTVTMRPSISVGVKPLYVHTMVTTGMSM